MMTCRHEDLEDFSVISQNVVL